MSLIVLENGLYDGLIGAAIGAAIALITTVITFVIGFKNIGFSYKSLFAETVSNSRNNWINVWRDEISKFLAISDILRHEKKYVEKGWDDDHYLDLLKEYHISKNKVLMRLNMNEKRHQEVYILINKIAYEKGLEDEEYKKWKECLMTVTRDLLKDEWERVKAEAGGKKR